MPGVVVLLLSLAVLLGGIVVVDRLPPRHSPFAPLDLDDAIGWATKTKIARLRDEPEQCRAAVSRSGLRATPVPDTGTGTVCGFRDALAVERSAIAYSAPVRASCPLVAALFVWEREVVQPAARRTLGSEVVRIEQGGVYACRNIGGGPADPDTGRPSEHATANAIDVSGFRLADGRRVSLLRGWDGPPAEQAFLREIRDGACRVFRVVLGPDYDAAHRDHFHFDMGRSRVCR